jgi:flagellar hook-basal body complex protein FliE
MSIEAIPALGASPEIAALDPSAAALSAAEPADGAFETVLNSLQGLNSQLLADNQAVAGLALGNTDNLHQVIMHSEQTRLDFELMLAVRTKVLEAYQELMRMQV